MKRNRWIVYAVALAVGVGAGLVTHSGVVSGIVALLVAVAWVGVLERT